jgi:mannose-6-phosphate isomerase-like protein (cupin superfamily)
MKKKHLFLLQVKRVLPAFLILISAEISAQRLNLEPERKTNGNLTEVFPLASDSLSSSFLIYIHAEVAPHYHAHHSEHVLVLEGEGTMLLNDSTIALKPQTAVFIPKGSVHSAQNTGSIPLKVISVQAPFFDGKDRIHIKKLEQGY